MTKFKEIKGEKWKQLKSYNGSKYIAQNYEFFLQYTRSELLDSSSIDQILLEKNINVNMCVSMYEFEYVQFKGCASFEWWLKSLASI